jgi:uncharacterized protein (DUF58 family)
VGALLVTAVTLVANAATRGRLEIVPNSQTITARARRPVSVAFRLTNRGRGTLHLLGVSGG